MVLFLFREEYYVLAKEPKRPVEGDDVKIFDEHAKWAAELDRVAGISELIVAKQRHGSTGIVDLHFAKHITKFSDIADDAYLPDRMD